jgi:O-antigen/teichoic acid export membrane protein
LTTASIVAAGVGFFQTVGAARMLGPGEYGTAALIVAFVGAVHAFLGVKPLEGAMKFLAEFDATRSPVRALAVARFSYVVDASVALACVALVAAAAPWASTRLGLSHDAVDLMRWYAVALLPGALTATSTAIFAVGEHLGGLAWLEIVTQALRTAIVLGLLLAGFQVKAVVIGNAVATAVQGIVYGALAAGIAKRRWGGHWLTVRGGALAGRRAEIMRFYAFNDVQGLLAMIPKQLDVLGLGLVADLQTVGCYKLVRSISSAAGFVVNPLQMVAYPRLGALWSRGDRGGMSRELQRCAWGVGIPVGLVWFVAAVLGPFALPLVAGPAFRGGEVPLFLLLALNAAWIALFWLRPAYMATEGVRAWTIGSAWQAVAFAIVAVGLVPSLGASGLAAAHLLTTLGFWTAMLVRLPDLLRLAVVEADT